MKNLTEGERLAYAQLVLAGRLAVECAEFASTMRDGPALMPEMYGKPISSSEMGHTTKILLEVIQELQEGDIADLFNYLTKA